MSSNALERVSQGNLAPRTASQAAAIEQARAVAEVQAAVTVALQFPRDMERAMGDMRAACSRKSLAEKAFYSVPNRGTGASVHLARELARIWGNIDYGVRELRRDDAAGESEIQAFAWDLQTNSRSSRSFIVPHAKMAGGKRKALVDLGDIYLNNQNTGARAVREAIFSVLPADFLDEAQARCRKTLHDGEGETLEQRVRKALDAFRSIGVSEQQLEDKVGRKRGTWTPADVADLSLRFQAIRRGDLVLEDEFPPQRVTSADLRAQPPTTAPQHPQAPAGVDTTTGEVPDDYDPTLDPSWGQQDPQ
ncbi:hypothetical protein GCM10027586_12900 [Kineococcus gypseus]|uniref:hypothetical protein n=1 Tax=Kineococcus gypseus TaxID=1637102 RepID=UPI003D7E19E2